MPAEPSSVVVRTRTLAEARNAIDRGEAFAAVEIPAGTERDVLKGITAHIPIYADATYLFIFRSTASGVATAVGALTSDLVSRGARTDGSLVKAKLASSSPADVLLQPIFNPVGGYASYVVPAAFLLILQQTLLIGAAMLTGTALAKGGGAFAGVLGRGIAHLTIYLPAVALYLIVLPRIYGFSTLGHLPQVFALATVFLLATSFMGQAVGAWFTRPENADHPHPRDKPASVLHHRLRVAARSNPRSSQGLGPDFPRRLCHRWPRAHQPARRQHLGGRA